jgi:FkbM family methyltransferase
VANMIGRLLGHFRNRTIVRDRAGNRIVVDLRDNSVGAALRAFGEWEPHVAATMARFLRDGDVVVEVGSNVGAHVVNLSRNVGPSGKVFAIEANPEVAKLLRATLRSNRLRNVTVFENAILDKPADVELWASEDNLGGGAVALPGWESDPQLASWKRYRVSATTLDLLFADLPEINLLHIDAEGCELAVLAGAANLLSRSPDVAIVAEWGAYHAPSYFDIEKGLDLLAEMGFQCSCIERDATLRPLSVEQLLEREFCDILMLRHRRDCNRNAR